MILLFMLLIECVMVFLLFWSTDPVDIDLVLELRVPVSSVPSGFINLFRQNVNDSLLPFSITQSLKVVSLNFTTGKTHHLLSCYLVSYVWLIKCLINKYVLIWNLSVKGCYPNSTGGLQCECEENFAWSCDTCNNFTVCSNATGPTCGCINGLPSDGQFCEPITGKRCYVVAVSLEVIQKDTKSTLTVSAWLSYICWHKHGCVTFSCLLNMESHVKWWWWCLCIVISN